MRVLVTVVQLCPSDARQEHAVAECLEQQATRFVVPHDATGGTLTPDLPDLDCVCRLGHNSSFAMLQDQNWSFP